MLLEEGGRPVPGAVQVTDAPQIPQRVPGRCALGMGQPRLNEHRVIVVHLEHIFPHLRIGKATGGIGLVVIDLRLGVIDNSRRAAYGYDQRVEVFGSLGMAADENDGDTTVRVSTVDGVVSDKPQFFFLERYMGSFIAEMKQFIHAIQTNGEVPVGIHAGLMSVVLAKAAKKSLDEHRPVKIAEILEA